MAARRQALLIEKRFAIVFELRHVSGNEPSTTASPPGCQFDFSALGALILLDESPRGAGHFRYSQFLGERLIPKDFRQREVRWLHERLDVTH
jgi:hypothetical protein